MLIWIQFYLIYIPIKVIYYCLIQLKYQFSFKWKVKLIFHITFFLKRLFSYKKFEIELCVQQVANCILTGSVRRGCADLSLLQALLIKGVMQFTRLLYVSLTAKDAIGEQRKSVLRYTSCSHYTDFMYSKMQGF